MKYLLTAPGADLARSLEGYRTFFSMGRASSTIPDPRPEAAPPTRSCRQVRVIGWLRQVGFEAGALVSCILYDGYVRTARQPHLAWTIDLLGGRGGGGGALENPERSALPPWRRRGVLAASGAGSLRCRLGWPASFGSPLRDCWDLFWGYRGVGAW